MAVLRLSGRAADRADRARGDPRPGERMAGDARLASGPRRHCGARDWRRWDSLPAHGLAALRPGPGLQRGRRAQRSRERTPDARRRGFASTPTASCFRRPSDPRARRPRARSSSRHLHPPAQPRRRALAGGGDHAPRSRPPLARAHLRIVGSAPPREVLELAGPRRRGDRRRTQRARRTSPRPPVVIAPVRSGGGMRMKVLEAMAIGKAVVTTRLGAEGFTGFGEEPPLAIAGLGRGNRRGDRAPPLRGDRPPRARPACTAVRAGAPQPGRLGGPARKRLRGGPRARGGARRARGAMTSEQPVELSILIASHNRKELLRRCLDSLARSDPASQLRGGRRRRWLRRRHRRDGRRASRRRSGCECCDWRRAASRPLSTPAIDAAEGDVCLFLDDDVIASPELVAAHLKAHRNETLLGVGAIVQRPPDARDWYAHAFARAWGEH